MNPADAHRQLLSDAEKVRFAEMAAQRSGGGAGGAGGGDGKDGKDCVVA
jgi:hypothetical protein